MTERNSRTTLFDRIHALLAATLISVLAANYFVFIVVPTEQIMGAVQRVFYFHVAAAIGTYLLIGIMLLSGLAYLSTRNDDWDLRQGAASSVAFLFCTIVLLSGMIWGHSAWNTWWRWEPRLVSFLVLWLILFSYVVLRSLMPESTRRAQVSSVLSVIAAINVPIVVYSIRFLSHVEQLHPEVMSRPGGLEPIMRIAFYISMLAVLLLGILLYSVKLENIRLARVMRDLERRR